MTNGSRTSWPLRPGGVAVVSGASSGLGRHLATDLATHGITTLAVARREGALRELAEGLRVGAPDSDYRVCDVSDGEAWRTVLAEIESQFGAIALLAQFAGTEARLSALEAARGPGLDHYRETLATNTFGAIAGTLQVLPGMAERDQGFVVNVSSDQGRAPTPRTSAYSASKAALSAFTESVAYEHHHSDVHLHVCYPGWVPTPMGQSAVDGGMDLPPKIVRRTPEDVTSAIRDSLGNGRVEINVARVAAFAPVARLLAPRRYARNLARR